MGAREDLAEHLANRPSELKKLKAQGQKIVGYFMGDYVPEEIIYASGAIPLGLLHGGDPESVELAHSLTTRYLCPFSRAQYGNRVLEEQPYYQMVDLLVTPITCQHLKRICELWNYSTEVKIFRLGIPYQYDSEHSLEYYQEGLGLLQELMEEITGQAKIRIVGDELGDSKTYYEQINSIKEMEGIQARLPFIYSIN